MSGVSMRGLVVGDKPDKTVIVQIVALRRHIKYGKVVKVYTKCYAHDEKNFFKKGDLVRLISSRPMSALKRWIVVYPDEVESSGLVGGS